MAVTISPTAPQAGDVVTITGTPSTDEGQSVFVFALTEVPALSSLATGVFLHNYADSTEVPLSGRLIAEAEKEGNTLTVDADGVYTLTSLEYRKTVRPTGITCFPIAGPTTETFEVVQLQQLRVRTEKPEHAASIQIATGDTTIIEATIVDPQSEVARLAIASDAVALELGRAAGLTAATFGEDFVARVVEFRTRWNDHVEDATEHTAADSVNLILNGVPNDIQGAIQVLNEARLKVIRHMQEIYGAALHTNPDLGSLVLAAPATTLAQATVLEADLSRVYADHRRRGSGETPPIHGTAGGDKPNGLRKALQAAILQDDSAETLTDYTTEANSAATADTPLLPSTATAWETGDAFYIGSHAPFLELYALISTAAVGGHAITWEYSNAASGFTALSGVVDDTNSWKVSGGAAPLPITWDDPGGDWTPATINGQGPFYFARGRVTTPEASPTTQPVASVIYKRIAPEILPRIVTAYIDAVQSTSVDSAELGAAAYAAQRYGFERV